MDKFVRDARGPLRARPPGHCAGRVSVRCSRCCCALFDAGDAPGRLLFGIATRAARRLRGDRSDLFAPADRVRGRPRPSARRSPRARVPWAQVADVHAASRTRFGLRSTTLEIDAGAVLAVLSRRCPRRGSGTRRAGRARLPAALTRRHQAAVP